MSCRCERMGWMGHGHDYGCPYDEGKTPWFELDLDRMGKKIGKLEADNMRLRDLLKKAKIYIAYSPSPEAGNRLLVQIVEALEETKNG